MSKTSFLDPASLRQLINKIKAKLGLMTSRIDSLDDWLNSLSNWSNGVNDWTSDRDQKINYLLDAVSGLGKIDPESLKNDVKEYTDNELRQMWDWLNRALDQMNSSFNPNDIQNLSARVSSVETVSQNLANINRWRSPDYNSMRSWTWSQSYGGRMANKNIEEIATRTYRIWLTNVGDNIANLKVIGQSTNVPRSFNILYIPSCPNESPSYTIRSKMIFANATASTADTRQRQHINMMFETPTIVDYGGYMLLHDSSGEGDLSATPVPTAGTRIYPIGKGGPVAATSGGIYKTTGAQEFIPITMQPYIYWNGKVGPTTDSNNRSMMFVICTMNNTLTSGTYMVQYVMYLDMYLPKHTLTQVRAAADKGEL